MGSCVSSRNNERMKNNNNNNSSKSDTCIKNHHHDDNNNVMTMIPPSPIKEKLDDNLLLVKPQWVPLHSSANSRDFGSKEETFFDSQAWLDSDCESDFMSVNGEFTPSRGNTPVHHNLPTGTPLIKGGAPTLDDHKPSMTTLSHPSPTPIKKKKRLSDLFRESLRENHNNDDDDEHGEPAKDNEEAAGRLEAAAVHGGGLKPKRERWAEIVHVNGCLPRALSSCRPVSTRHTEARQK